jgi:hypothetical protein
MNQPPGPPYFEREIDLWKLLLLSLLFGGLLLWMLLDGAAARMSALPAFLIFATPVHL